MASTDAEVAPNPFDPVQEEQRRAHAMLNALNKLTGSPPRCCWVCGTHADTRTATDWQVLDDDAEWQPLCSVECWAKLAAPDVRWNVHRFGPDHSLGSPDLARELRSAPYRQHGRR